jgi:hypothetical protein
MVSGEVFLARHTAAGHVAILGEHDKVHALVALLKVIKFILKILFAFGIVH